MAGVSDNQNYFSKYFFDFQADSTKKKLSKNRMGHINSTYDRCIHEALPLILLHLRGRKVASLSTGKIKGNVSWLLMFEKFLLEILPVKNMITFVIARKQRISKFSKNWEQILMYLV